MSKKAEGFSLRFVLINTGNISRKVLSKVLRSFVKNFERLQKDILDGAEDVKETKKRITENRETICLVAEQEIQKQGYTYPVSVNLEKCYFPMKTYGDCTFPAGTYEALRVCIGKAKGRNWWCVLYPSLCFADSVNVIVPDEKKQELKNILTEEEYESLFDWREDDYQIRSGFLRLWRKLFA